MNRLKMLLKQLAKKGFATKDEKEKMWQLFEKMTDEQQETVAAEVETAETLPEEKPVESADPSADVEEKLEKLFSNLETKMGEKLNTEVKNLIKQEIEMNAKRVGVYSNTSTDAVAKRKAHNEYLRKFLNALASEDMATLKEMSTDATGSPYAGYVVDSELSAEIRHLITQYGVARREMQAIQLTKGSYKANDLVTDVSVFWVDEGTSISSSQVVLGQEPLELKKLGVIVAMTAELLEDQEIDLMSFVATRVAENFAKAEDEAFFKGDGTSTYGSFTGLLNNTSTNNVVMTGTSFANIDADDLIDMQDATPSGAQANAKYYMHRTILSFIRKLIGTDGQYIYQRPSENLPATVWDKPVVTVEAMPSKLDSAEDTAFVLYGDLRQACIFGYKGEIRASQHDTGIIRNVAGNADINLLTTDRIAVRWIERVGFITILPSAVTRLTTGSASV
jgi:HK97 family phage major capsid protein